MHELFVMIVAQRRRFGWVKFPLKMLREMGIPFSERLVVEATRKQKAVEYDRTYNLGRSRKTHRKRLKDAKTASHDALVAKDIAADPKVLYKGRHAKNKVLRKLIDDDPSTLSDGPRDTMFDPTGSRVSLAAERSLGTARACTACSTTHGQLTTEGCFTCRPKASQDGTVSATNLQFCADLFD
jgi:hypothetical protein